MLQKLLQCVKPFRRDEHGNIAIVFAATITPIVVALGASVDYGRSYNVRTHMQNALDAAVVGAAKATNLDTAERVDLAKRLFRDNFDTAFAATPEPNITADGKYISGSASVDVKSTFLGVAGINEVEVSVQSGASAVDPKPICLLALNETMSKAIEIAGTGTLSAIDCSAHANSTAEDALYAGGSSYATAQMFCSIGGSVGDNFSPAPKTCGYVEDPYAGLQMPFVGSCDHNNKKLMHHQGPITLQPGVYCGGLEIAVHADVTFAPGTYIIKDGPLSVASGAYASGLGVVFYLTGENSYIDIDGGATLNLEADTEGDFEGYLFIQARGSGGAGLTSEFNGGGSLTMVGAIYLPDQTVLITGNGSFGLSSPLMPIIADSFIIRGNGVFQIDMDQANMDINLPMTNDGSVVLN